PHYEQRLQHDPHYEQRLQHDPHYEQRLQHDPRYEQRLNDGRQQRDEHYDPRYDQRPHEGRNLHDQRDDRYDGRNPHEQRDEHYDPRGDRYDGRNPHEQRDDHYDPRGDHYDQESFRMSQNRDNPDFTPRRHHSSLNNNSYSDDHDSYNRYTSDYDRPDEFTNPQRSYDNRSEYYDNSNYRAPSDHRTYRDRQHSYDQRNIRCANERFGNTQNGGNTQGGFQEGQKHHYGYENNQGHFYDHRQSHRNDHYWNDHRPDRNDYGPNYDDYGPNQRPDHNNFRPDDNRNTDWCNKPKLENGYRNTNTGHNKNDIPVNNNMSNHNTVKNNTDNHTKQDQYAIANSPSNWQNRPSGISQINRSDAKGSTHLIAQNKRPDIGTKPVNQLKKNLNIESKIIRRTIFPRKRKIISGIPEKSIVVETTQPTKRENEMADDLIIKDIVTDTIQGETIKDKVSDTIKGEKKTESADKVTDSVDKVSDTKKKEKTPSVTKKSKKQNSKNLKTDQKIDQKDKITETSVKRPKKEIKNTVIGSQIDEYEKKCKDKKILIKEKEREEKQKILYKNVVDELKDKKAQIWNNQLKQQQNERSDNGLQVKASTIHGMGLFSQKFIKEGDHIIEYTGAIIGDTMADKLEEEYKSYGMNDIYFFRLDEDKIIDATVLGNRARYINHSCDPSAEARVHNEGIHIFALRDIQKEEEITIHYNMGKGEAIPCRCRS
ncbi:histone H3 (Lys4) methyltransferase complex, subunit SET1, partial [Pseudoloma neurophilia]